MIIFDRNGQTLTKHNHSYVAKEFDLFWAKRAFSGPEILYKGEL